MPWVEPTVLVVTPTLIQLIEQQARVNHKQLIRMASAYHFLCALKLSVLPNQNDFFKECLHMWLFAFDLALLVILRLNWPPQKLEKTFEPIKYEETSDKLILEFEKDQEIHLVSTNLGAIQPMRTSPSIIVNEHFVEHMRFSKPSCYETQKKWFVPLSTYLLYHRSALDQQGTCRIFTFEFGFVI